MGTIYYVEVQLFINSKPTGKVRPIIEAIFLTGGNIIFFLPTQAITAETATLLNSKTPEIKVSDQYTFFCYRLDFLTLKYALVLVLLFVFSKSIL